MKPPGPRTNRAHQIAPGTRKRPAPVASVGAAIAYAVAALALGFIFMPAAATAAGGQVIPIHFAAGRDATKLTGTVTRNRADTYSLVAEAGQTLSIEVEAPDGNLLPIEVGLSGAKTHVDSDGYGQSWHGKIPTTGPFEITVRGSDPAEPARYTLLITISGFAADPSLPRGIEQVDFGDGTVFFGARSHRLRAGHLAAPDPQDALLQASIDPPAFGEIEGYPAELAAILIRSYERDATGLFSELNLFALRGGRPVLVADLPGGDRADGGLHAVTIANKRLVVEVFAPPPTGGICCPGFVDTVHYRFAGGKLVRDGKPSRRKAVEGKDY